MRTISRTTFTTVKTEGAILPADLLQRVADGRGLEGLNPADYHLAPNERLNEAINRAWNRCLGVWQSFQEQRGRLPASDAGTTLTRERWLLILFQELGYGRLPYQASLPLGPADDAPRYPISHAWGHAPIHLITFRQDLDRRDAANQRSPHSLMQEYLNRAEGSLWGFLSNGLRLRLLRDNASLTRAAYVEFDLEAMMGGELYADFALLWLVCHQSRVEGERPTECWLERWSQAAAQQGTRALDALRNGVQEAIAALGRGFLGQRANAELKAGLRSGDLSAQDYYRQLLRLVYRLIFLFVAEDRDLLLLPDAPANTRRRYADYYSVRRLRDLAEAQRGGPHPDLYRNLRLVFGLLRTGYPALALPGLGSYLFSEQATPALDGADLANRDLLDAIRALAFTIEGRVRRPVDYKNLGAEELGSVYESLLELHPQLNTDAGTFALDVAAGSERKTTGSYYTPSSLIRCLLDSALEPVVEDRLQHAGSDPAAREAALLDVKVVDPAAGSGHFLIAAAHRLARHLARVRTGDEEPAPTELRGALRDVVRYCIHGVDINPMAVELCKVALWMETIDPGRPLSFLDRNIQCGNSLIGATPALLEKGIPDEAFTPIEGDDKAYCAEWRKRNKQQREGKQLSLFAPDLQPWNRLGNLAASMMTLDAVGENSVDDVRRKQQMYEDLVRSSDYRYGRLWADAWCAAFVWKKNKEFAYPITEEVFRRIERNPFDVAPWMVEEIERLREQYQFFHWHLAFPHVFPIGTTEEEAENEQAGWSGGFDVLLGNPPWEMPETDDRVFFTSYRLDIALEGSAKKRHQLIAALDQTEPTLFQQWEDYLRVNSFQRAFFVLSGRYVYSSKGRLNYHRLFVEHNWHLANSHGLVGMIVPSGLATNKYEEPIWHHLLTKRAVVSLYDFENSEGLFPAVHRSMKFSLLTLAKILSSQFEAGCWLTRVEDLKDSDRIADFTLADLVVFAPDSWALPQFRYRKDLDLLRAAHNSWPQFSESIGWDHTLRLMFSSSDRDYAPVLDDQTTDWHVFPYGRKRRHDGAIFVPVFEGKMVALYDHRDADVYVNLNNPARQAQPRPIPEVEKKNPLRFARPQHWLEEGLIRKKRLYQAQGDWTLAFCDVTGAANERTSISALIPLSGLTRSMPAVYLVNCSACDASRLSSVLSSFVLDFFCRLKVSTNHLTQGILESLPIPQMEFFVRLEEGLSGAGWMTKRVLELTYTAWDLQPFAQDCGYDGPPFRWDEERRFLLRCELDAAYFHLYGIERDDVDYIMDTFPIVRRKDEAAHGEYRTKRVILEIYDQMKEAMETGQAYQTRLDPPPADPRVAHPARE